MVGVEGSVMNMVGASIIVPIKDSKAMRGIVGWPKP